MSSITQAVAFDDVRAHARPKTKKVKKCKMAVDRNPITHIIPFCPKRGQKSKANKRAIFEN
jgi:hypothetical protein